MEAKEDDAVINEPQRFKEKFLINHENVYKTIYQLYTSLGEVFDIKCSIFTEHQEALMMELIEILEKYAPEGNFHVIERPRYKDLQGQVFLTYLSESGPGPKTVQTAKKTKLKNVIVELDCDEELSTQITKDRVQLLHRIMDMPGVEDDADADIRKEPLIRKLVAHTKKNTINLGNRKELDSECTNTSTWVIQLFRGMIEHSWGLTIDERDEFGDDESDEKAAPSQNALNDCGATGLCLELIAIGIDDELILEATKLLVGLLYREGGNTDVQQTMHNYLTSHDSELFFRYMKETIEKLKIWHTYSSAAQKVLDEDDEPDLPPTILNVRLLQLMCEGHFLANQDIMREQRGRNRESVNLLDDLANYLTLLSKQPCRISTAAANQVAATILELIQGPCSGNQYHLAIHTELLETLNRMMRAKTIGDCVEEEEEELKKTALAIFRGLVEGEGKESVIYERILSIIHLDVLQLHINPPGSDKDEDGKTKELTELQTGSLVLLEMLCDFKPILRESISIPNKEEKFGKNVSSVEVVWNGSLQRRFFHVPEICFDLSEASKDKLVEEVCRDNQELKLQDFLLRCKDLHREINHQQMLKEFHQLDRIFSRKNQETATWVAFLLACSINCMMLLVYKRNEVKVPDDDSLTLQNLYEQIPTMVAPYDTIVFALNSINTGFSAFVLVLFLVVRVPVKVTTRVAAGGDEVFSWFVCVFGDGQTMYYFIYVVISLLANISQHYFAPFLLLDIVVKDSTTRDVLNAVIVPLKPLTMTACLGLFVIYIFASFIFFLFPYDFAFSDDVTEMTDCMTLWDCFLCSMNYGMRLSGGTGDIQTHTLGVRLWLDFAYFILVLVILLNIIFGIIIDTFSELRSNKKDKLLDTTDKCFICGISKHTFDRASPHPQGFKQHIKSDHNMWSYLYFIIFIWEQDRDDDDGLEQFVRQCLDAEDIQFFPMDKAMVLANNDENLEDLAAQMERMGKTIENNSSQNIDILLKANEKNIGNLHTQIENVIEKVVDNQKLSQKKFNQIHRAVAELKNIVKQGDFAQSQAPDQSQSPPEEGGEAKDPAVTTETESKTAESKASDENDEDNRISRLCRVQIEDAAGLVQPFLFGTADPFVVVHIYENNVFFAQSEIIWMSSDPAWSNAAPNTFTFNLHDAKLDDLRLEVHHVHRRGRGNFLGEISLNWQNVLKKEHNGEKIMLKLQKKDSQNRLTQKYVQGSIGLRVWVADPS